MRPEAVEPIKKAIGKAAALNLDGAFLFLTNTGRAKSIMDATAPVRDYLATEGIHDYLTQGQGPQYKSRIKAYFVGVHDLIPSHASLYRPLTKSGDPRIWFDGLAKYANAGDVLCVLAFKEELFVLNTESEEIWHSASVPGTPMFTLIQNIHESKNKTAAKLLSLIRARTCLPLRTVCAGSTGVGATLEHVLGIRPNSLRTPDWNGIEIKAGRRKKGFNVRSTLFAQVPNWEISSVKSSKELVFKYGYLRDGLQRLNCQVSALRVNSQGLYLSMNEQSGLLHERFTRGLERTDPKSLREYEEVVSWEIKTLKERLLEKHRETFWVSAKATGSGIDEVFEYYEIEHTKGPLINAFSTLLDAGIVTLDHLIKCAPENGVAKERGPLFKIDKRNFGLLFPPSQKYSLR